MSLRRTVFDMTTGSTRIEQLTAAEEAELRLLQQNQQADDTARRAGLAQRATDLATIQVKAQTDPAFAALLRLLS